MQKWILIGALAACSAGCGDSSSLVAVEGVVTLNGTPLADATVALRSARINDPGPFSGLTDAQGRFSLGVPAAGDQEAQPGVAPGTYLLSISTVKTIPTVDESTPLPKQMPREVVPPEYRNGSMHVVVPPDGLTDLKFDMKSR